jgi:hypothetical protein
MFEKSDRSTLLSAGMMRCSGRYPFAALYCDSWLDTHAGRSNPVDAIPLTETPQTTFEPTQTSLALSQAVLTMSPCLALLRALYLGAFLVSRRLPCTVTVKLLHFTFFRCEHFIHPNSHASTSLLPHSLLSRKATVSLGHSATFPSKS